MIQVEILSDGKTVWVNDETCLIGRFSKFGIDIHKDANGQMAGGHCLDCKPGPVAHRDWTKFQSGMLKHHGVLVPDKHMPAFLRKQGQRQ